MDTQNRRFWTCLYSCVWTPSASLPSGFLVSTGKNNSPNKSTRRTVYSAKRKKKQKTTTTLWECTPQTLGANRLPGEEGKQWPGSKMVILFISIPPADITTKFNTKSGLESQGWGGRAPPTVLPGPWLSIPRCQSTFITGVQMNCTETVSSVFGDSEWWIRGPQFGSQGNLDLTLELCECLDKSLKYPQPQCEDL